jgi:hypothetical protein
MREKINALVIVEGVAVYENFIRTLNAVIAKYVLLAKPRSGKGGEQSAPQNGTAEAQ